MASKGVSEYQEEFGFSRKAAHKKAFSDYKACLKSYETQPVGGRKVDAVEVAKSAKRVRCELCGKFCADANKDVAEETVKACTPLPPLTVPDVHKLRYCTNNYVSAYDWY